MVVTSLSRSRSGEPRSTTKPSHMVEVEPPWLADGERARPASGGPRAGGARCWPRRRGRRHGRAGLEVRARSGQRELQRVDRLGPGRVEHGHHLALGVEHPPALIGAHVGGDRDALDDLDAHAPQRPALDPDPLDPGVGGQGRLGLAQVGAEQGRAVELVDHLLQAGRVGVGGAGDRRRR